VPGFSYMAKKILLIFAALVILISAGVIYLNRVYLPTKVKALIVKGIEDTTQKKVSLDSLNFNVFKGLVLKGLTIYDDTGILLSLEEGSCTFLILPVFKKNIILPTIRLKSPVLFLARKADNSLNILEPFFKKSAKAGKNGFNILFYKISITDARINFKDDTLTPFFSKSINNISLAVTYSLPNKVSFNLKCEIPAVLPLKITSLGQYNITQQELKANVAIKDLSPGEFSGYYRDLGLVFPNGKIDADLDLRFKDKELNVDLDLQSKSLAFTREKISAKLNSTVKASLKYSLKDKQLGYSGKAVISDSAVSGIEFAGKIDGINGEVKFDNSGLTSENLRANCLGLAVAAKMNLTDFSDPLIKIHATSSLNLSAAQNILKDKFKITFPAQIQGQGQVFLTVESGAGSTRIDGFIDVINSTLKFEKNGPVFENINGKLKFTPSQLSWPDLNFKYLGINYKTDGTLVNFGAPAVEFKISSKDLNLESALAISGKRIKFSKLNGSYINSRFSLAGELDLTGSSAVNADIGGSLDIDLNDLAVPLVKFKNELERIKPVGIVHAQGQLSGNIKDIRSCSLQARLSGGSISFYGLKSGDFLLSYNQENRIAEIAQMQMLLYDGIINAAGKMNFGSDNLPFWVSADIQGVNLEKLKMDTPAKNNDIAGILRGDVKINGYSGDLSRLSGAGNIFITGGKLWQLNLFKGMGKLIFAEDLARVVFSEGYCGFVIQNKSFFTDSFKLKSNLAELDGTAKIGFDSTIDASIKIHILDEMVPLQNNLKDIITTIIGQSNAFGLIKITGTLQQPKYKFKPAVVDIFKGLKDSAIGNIF